MNVASQPTIWRKKLAMSPEQVVGLIIHYEETNTGETHKDRRKAICNKRCNQQAEHGDAQEVKAQARSLNDKLLHAMAVEMPRNI
jgi:hypothetical protein